MFCAMISKLITSAISCPVGKDTLFSGRMREIMMDEYPRYKSHEKVIWDIEDFISVAIRIYNDNIKDSARTEPPG